MAKDTVILRALALTALLPCLTCYAGSPAIDGRIDATEWEGAQTITDFRKVQPLNGEPASLANTGRILSTPQGLALAFRAQHPVSVPRRQQRLSRDFKEQVDRINVMIDFDGDGRTGYAFTVSSTDDIYDAVVTDENDFNSDWDGKWQHAVTQDEDGWSVEILIPWHIAPMKEASGDTRRLKIYLDRVIGETGERSAWPQASIDRPRFLSDFAAIDVSNFGQSLLAVTPFISSVYDNVRDDGRFDGGVDVFWKPNGQTQLTATVNPDFGQVESDDLIVNFNATEIFISDKRPFFTENQGIFDFTTPSTFSQLLYTRRVGAPADDGNGSGDITAALKLNGSVGATKYGVFAADEDDDVGRTFGALRVVRDFANQNLGLMATTVERPYLDRTANVVGIDHNWRPTARWNVRSRVLGSDVDQSGTSTSDIGATLLTDYEFDGSWRAQFVGMHFGDELQLNDAGYLARNDLDQGHVQVSRRFTALPESSRYASKDWRAKLMTSRNTDGLLLTHQVLVSRESQLRDGSFEFLQFNVNSAGADDLLTRGGVELDRPPSFGVYATYQRPRKGNWAYEATAEMFSGKLKGNDIVGYSVQFQPAYFFSDAFNVYIGAYYERNPDWVLWRGANLIGSFDNRETHFDAGFNWIGSHHELRLKVQAIGINAPLRDAYRLSATGYAAPTNEPLEDVSVRNLGIQLRYRYEIAPLSYLYIVYGRGGYSQDPDIEPAARSLRESFELRDDEQLLIKLSYRFER